MYNFFKVWAYIYDLLNWITWLRNNHKNLEAIEVDGRFSHHPGQFDDNILF